MLCFLSYLGVYSSLLYDESSEHFMSLMFVVEYLFLLVHITLESTRGEYVSNIVSALLDSKIMVPTPLSGATTLFFVIIFIMVQISSSHSGSWPAIHGAAISLCPGMHD